MCNKLNFYTQYHQIYIADSELKDTDAMDFGTNEEYISRLAIGQGLLAVYLECYGDFSGEVKILEREEAAIDFDKFDHIVEGGLNVPSGLVQILDCPNSHVEWEMKVPPGKYRARIYSSNLASVIGDSGDDYYKIELWPDTNLERKVLKQLLR